MKKYKKLFTVLFLMAFLFCLSGQTAFAFSESDAQAQVDAAGREAVSGNVLVYYNVFMVDIPNNQLGCYPSYCLSC